MNVKTIQGSPINDPLQQKLLFQELSNRLRSKFLSLRQLKYDDVFTGYANPASSHYTLRIMLRGSWFGCALYGPRMDNPNRIGWLINFSTYSGETGTQLVAARLVEHEGNINLLHDGNVRGTGANEPLSGQKVISNGKEFFHVSDFYSDMFMEKLIAFHESRINPNLEAYSSDEDNNIGFDPGQKSGGQRSSAVFYAKHSPVANALLILLKKKSYETTKCELFSPDILVANSYERILFEIKSEAKLHDIIIGCGQLLVYNELARATKLVLVSKKLNDTLKSLSLLNFMKKFGIIHLDYSIDNDDYFFHDLDVILEK